MGLQISSGIYPEMSQEGRRGKNKAISWGRVSRNSCAEEESDIRRAHDSGAGAEDDRGPAEERGIRRVN